MASYQQILYHLIFHTRNSEKVLGSSENDELFKHIRSVLKFNNCKSYGINGVDDHIHIVCDLHPSVALAFLIKELKTSSSVWIKKRTLYPLFTDWAEGSGAFTLSMKEKDSMINYLLNQQEHHQTENFREEYIRILNENGIEFDEKYLL